MSNEQQKITCLICGTPVPLSEISNHGPLTGLPALTCKICVSVMDYSITTVGELAGKSLLKRAEILIAKNNKEDEIEN